LRRILIKDYSNEKNRYIYESKTGLKNRKSHSNRLKANRTNVPLALSQISFAQANEKSYFKAGFADRKSFSG
jgi:hypothetical protein